MRKAESLSVTILGNLLDNAIHATLKQMKQMDRPVITLSVTWQQGNLFLHLSNPCNAKTVPEYGTGLRNVEETVKKYSGTMQASVENGNYITDIVLYSVRDK